MFSFSGDFESHAPEMCSGKKWAMGFKKSKVALESGIVLDGVSEESTTFIAYVRPFLGRPRGDEVSFSEALL